MRLINQIRFNSGENNLTVRFDCTICGHIVKYIVFVFSTEIVCITGASWLYAFFQVSDVFNPVEYARRAKW